MLVNSPADLSNFTFPNLKDLAIKTGFIIRDSLKMDASMFVQTIVAAAISGKASYNQLAHGLGQRTGHPMSRQGMKDRFKNVACIEFLTSTHDALVEAQILAVEEPLLKCRIERVVIEDSSGIWMPKSNAHHFPAHGNHHGKTAGVKVNFAYDILNHTVLNHTLHRATEQDKSIGKESVIDLQEGDLSVRDMGYFSLAELTHIESIGASWLTRLPLTTDVNLPDGSCLEDHLEASTGNVVDLGVIAGDSEKKKCRLVAVRADSKVAEKRRRDRKEAAKYNGKTPKQKSLIRDGWHIMLTNLEEGFTAKDLAAIYRIRWGIEIQFRAWKQASNLLSCMNRTSSENHMNCLVLGAMIGHLISVIVGRIFAKTLTLERISFEKVADILSGHHIGATQLEDILAIRIDPRHIVRDKRKAPTRFATGIAALA